MEEKRSMIWLDSGSLKGSFEEGAPVEVLKVVPVKVPYESHFWNCVRGGEIAGGFRYGPVRKKHLTASGIRLAQLDILGEEDDVLVVGTPVGDEKGMWVLICSD